LSAQFLYTLVYVHVCQPFRLLCPSFPIL
jgi:hypothetical protein